MAIFLANNQVRALDGHVINLDASNKGGANSSWLAIYIELISRGLKRFPKPKIFCPCWNTSKRCEHYERHSSREENKANEAKTALFTHIHNNLLGFTKYIYCMLRNTRLKANDDTSSQLNQIKNAFPRKCVSGTKPQ